MGLDNMLLLGAMMNTLLRTANLIGIHHKKALSIAFPHTNLL